MHKSSKHSSDSTGFTLIEVLVSLIIISLGILGVTGMLLKGVNNAKTANMRTLAALQAGSLASAMTANPGFWKSNTSPISVNVSATGTPTVSGMTLGNASDCVFTSGTATNCTPAQIAGSDMRNWLNSINVTLANAGAQLNCTAYLNPNARPVSCDIAITWHEHFVDSSKTQASDSAATSGDRSYILHFEP